MLVKYKHVVIKAWADIILLVTKENPNIFIKYLFKHADYKQFKLCSLVSQYLDDNKDA